MYISLTKKLDFKFVGVSFDVQLYRRDENLSHVILKSVLHMELDFRLPTSFVFDNLMLKAAKHWI